MTLNLNNIPDYVKSRIPFDFTVPNEIPNTNNYLANNRFHFFLRRCPNLTYFCQRANIPSISFGISLQSNPTGIAPIRRPGTAYTIEDMTIGFLVDEHMKNWIEIYNWMKSIGIYTSHNELLKEDDKISDAYMLITNSAYVPIIKVIFHNIFPTVLTGVDFDSTLTDTDPILANVTFAFTHYEIYNLPNIYEVASVPTAVEVAYAAALTSLASNCDEIIARFQQQP